MKTITIQFSKVVNVDRRELCEMLPVVFHDVVKAEIDADPKKQGIKTVVLHCDRCSPDEVLNFIRNWETMTKGVQMAENNNVPTTPAAMPDVDINKTCNDLAAGFQAIFGKTGGLAESLTTIQATIGNLQQTVDAQKLQIDALEKIVNGVAADPAKKTPAVAGLKDSVETIRTKANADVEAAKLTLSAAVDQKIAEVTKKEGRIDAVERSCRAIEDHLSKLPLFERTLNDGNAGTVATTRK